MSYLPKVSTLVLDTRDIQSEYDINATRSDFVFRNIDMDVLLGEDWRAHDMFNIMLVSTVFDTLTEGTIPTISVPEVRMSGLPFVDSDLRVSDKSQEIALTTIDCTTITTGPNIVHYPSGLIWTFNRADRGLMNFFFRLADPLTDGTITSSMYPHQQYIFKIYHL